MQSSYILARVPLPNVALTFLPPTGRIYLFKIKIVKGLYIFVAYYFVCACVSAHLLWCMSGGQRTTVSCQFLLSTVWGLGMEIRQPDLPELTFPL